MGTVISNFIADISFFRFHSIIDCLIHVNSLAFLINNVSALLSTTKFLLIIVVETSVKN